jgi:hypothetical protein
MAGDGEEGDVWAFEARFTMYDYAMTTAFYGFRTR